MTTTQTTMTEETMTDEMKQVAAGLAYRAMAAANVHFTDGVEGQPGAWENSHGQSARMKRLWQGALLAVDLEGEATFGHVPSTNAVRATEGGELEVRIMVRKIQ